VQVARHVTVPWYCHLLHDDATLSNIYNFTGFSLHSSSESEDGRMRHMVILPSISDFAKLGVRSLVRIAESVLQYLREILSVNII